MSRGLLHLEACHKESKKKPLQGRQGGATHCPSGPHADLQSSSQAMPQSHEDKVTRGFREQTVAASLLPYRLSTSLLPYRLSRTSQRSEATIRDGQEGKQ